MVAGIHTQGVAIGPGYDGLSALAAAAAAVETRCIASPHGGKRRYPASVCVSAVVKPPVLASVAKQSRKEAAWTALLRSSQLLAVTVGSDCFNSNYNPVHPLIPRIPVRTMNSIAGTVGAHCPSPVSLSSLLSSDAVWRPTRITPCKPQAQLGVRRTSVFRNCVAVELLRSSGRGRAISTPSCACGLHGVIHIQGLRPFKCKTFNPPALLPIRIHNSQFIIHN
jgi:hypothetical protein